MENHQENEVQIDAVGPDIDEVKADSFKNFDPASVPNAKERLYDKIPLSAKQLGVIIWILIFALIAAFVIGALVGNNIIDDPFFS
jgi:hypothetical protein